MLNNKVALITGVTGQDGSYLAELLLSKGYEVHGTRRRSSTDNTFRIKHLIQRAQEGKAKFKLHYSDVTDGTNLLKLIIQLSPDEIYNLAAQSHVHTSFENPEYTANTDALGVLRILEAIKIAGLVKKTKFYQASTSELYGKVQAPVQNEETPFYPRSPYGIAKQYAFWITKHYRETYDFFACNGILFNHESPLRGEGFVTRKITLGVARIKYGLQDCLHLGNLDAKRDWGHAREYVEGMWKMLQVDTPDDYVLATNKTVSVREFLIMAFSKVGYKIEFEGQGPNEVGRCVSSGKTLVKIDPYFYRDSEVDILLGDASKASEKLSWRPRVDLEGLCGEMVLADCLRVKKQLGFKVFTPEDIAIRTGNYDNWMSHASELEL